MLADALTKGMTSPHMVKYMTTGIVSVSGEGHPIHSRLFQRTIKNVDDKDLVDLVGVIKLFWSGASVGAMRHSVLLYFGGIHNT